MIVQVVALQPRRLVAHAVEPVEVVAARLDDGDHRDAGHSDRGVVAGGLDLNLFERVGVEVDARILIVAQHDVHAFDLELGLKRHAAGRDVLTIGHVAAADIGRAGQRHAGRHAVHHAQVAAARNLVERLRVERHARGRRHYVDDRAAARDGDRFFEVADLHDHVDARDETDGQAELVADERGEARQLELDGVDPDRQLSKPVVSVGVAHRDDLPDLQRGTRQRRGDTGQCAA